MVRRAVIFWGGLVLAANACGQVSGNDAQTSSAGGNAGAGGKTVDAGQGGAGAAVNGSGGAGCASTPSGCAGSGGSSVPDSGQIGHDGGTRSPGSTTITFSAEGGMYCRHGCDGPAELSIGVAQGQSFILTGECDVSCATCANMECPPLVCAPDDAVTGASFTWDGSYFAESKCGAGVSCVTPRFAPPGRYTATFCATPGAITGLHGGTAECTPLGPAQCTSIEFDFPSTTVATGTLTPAITQ
jgi:hypothetical protein